MKRQVILYTPDGSKVVDRVELSDKPVVVYKGKRYFVVEEGGAIGFISDKTLLELLRDEGYSMMNPFNNPEDTIDIAKSILEAVNAWLLPDHYFDYVAQDL